MHAAQQAGVLAMGPRLTGNCHSGGCDFAATLCALELVCFGKMNMFGVTTILSTIVCHHHA